MTEFYERFLPLYRAVGQNERKSSEHDSSIRLDCIPERRAAGKTLLVNGVLIDHKTDLALTADRRNHIDPLPLRLHRQHWRTALGRKATFYDLTVAYPSLIGPIDYGILRLRTP